MSGGRPTQDWDPEPARAWRQRRWATLAEDGAIFGLTGDESAELAALEREFGPSGLPAHMRTPDGGAGGGDGG